MVGDDPLLLFGSNIEDDLLRLLDSLPVFLASRSTNVKDVWHLEHLDPFLFLRGDEAVKLLDGGVVSKCVSLPSFPLS